MSHQKINDIEKRVAELKFLERDLIKERNVLRLKSLDKAEKSGIVDELVKSFFINTIDISPNELIVNSFPSKFDGRDNEEFLSEVRVEIRYKPADGSSDYNELAINVYLNSGFHDDEVRKNERRIMDRLCGIKKEVDELKESKKSLKQNI